MLLLPDGLKRVTPVLGPWVPTRLRPEFGMMVLLTLSVSRAGQSPLNVNVNGNEHVH